MREGGRNWVGLQGHLRTGAGLAAKQQAEQFRLGPCLCACMGMTASLIRRAPMPQVQTFGEVRVGLCHGHQIVPPGDRAVAAALQRKLDVDVLILGDAHKFQAYRHEGRFVISPGSATGAFTPSLLKPTPSFVLMDINGPRVSAALVVLRRSHCLGETGSVRAQA